MNGYRTTGRFWLVFILTICVLCAVGCGGSFDDAEDDSISVEAMPPKYCTMRPTPQFVGPVLPCYQAI